jgi:isopentenyldiphosphate isomerase
MDELVDIWDSAGNPTGMVALKSEAHRNGWFHPTVHIWFHTLSGKLLLQKRAITKDTFPGYWDVSVAGHLGAGENPVAGAIREIQEEIGLEVKNSELKQIGICKAIHHHKNGILDCEFHHIFLAQLNVDLGDLRPQDLEVDALKLFPFSVLNSDKLDKVEERLVPHGKPYYHKIINALSALL